MKWRIDMSPSTQEELQEVFDRIARHLLRQGQKSKKADSNACLYRGPEGLKCAVGILIPDTLYSEKLEDRMVTDSRVWEALEKAGIVRSRDMEALLVCLQVVHDSYRPVNWRAELREVAERFDLSPEVLS
jgi:hypothetical protein